MVVAVGLLIGWVVRSSPAEVAEVGAPAPDFTVEVIDGGAFTLSEAQGQPVVLNFWASWCGPCRTEIPDISTFAQANPGVTVIGVSWRDSDEASRDFADEVDASYPLALGTPAIENAYPNLGMPTTYILDSDGVVTDIINGIVDQEDLAEAVG